VEAAVVYVCENNLYMEYTPIHQVTAVKHPAADRASAYGLESIVVDGNDADEVYRAASEALAKARAGGGPSLIEAMTYRHSGHSRADPAKYRRRASSTAGSSATRSRSTRAAAQAGLCGGDLKDIESATTAKVDEATNAAKASPTPSLDLIYKDVWADGGWTWRN